MTDKETFLHKLDTVRQILYSYVLKEYTGQNLQKILAQTIDDLKKLEYMPDDPDSFADEPMRVRNSIKSNNYYDITAGKCIKDICVITQKLKKNNVLGINAQQKAFFIRLKSLIFNAPIAKEASLWSYLFQKNNTKPMAASVVQEPSEQDADVPEAEHIEFDASFDIVQRIFNKKKTRIIR